MNLQPLNDRIIIEAAPLEEKTIGGIYLPDTAKEKPQKGTVIAVGPGKALENGERAPMDIKPGDVVLYGKYGGTEVTIDGKDFTIVQSRDILAVLNAETANV